LGLEVRAFTGISGPYEEPVSPQLRLDTSVVSVVQGTTRILAKLSELGYLVGK
jgi:adenylylsulfate kinase-like enzyme